MDRKRLPKGVTIRPNKHSESIRISFYYKGIQCKETLSLDPTPANIKHAERKLAEIHNAIEYKRFNYADFFPESKNCRRFGHASSSITIAQMLDKYLATAKRTLKASTAKGYEEASRANLYPTFGNIRVVDLTSATIREWIEKKSVTMKRMKNILIPLNHVLNLAKTDKIIKENPLDSIVLTTIMPADTRKSKYKIDPFDQNEIEIFLNSTSHPQIFNYFQFAFYTGLRPSELLALHWGDIDWVNKKVRVDKAYVEEVLDGTKTVAGTRDVMLFAPALEALESQRAFTYMHQGHIFHNPLTNKPWRNDSEVRHHAWMPAMRKSKLRHRNQYQTRHTYGSNMCSRGENLWWLAAQMGHESPEMLYRHYGTWLEDVSKQAGYKPNYDWNAISFQKKA